MTSYRRYFPKRTLLNRKHFALHQFPAKSLMVLQIPGSAPVARVPAAPEPGSSSELQQNPQGWSDHTNERQPLSQTTPRLREGGKECELPMCRLQQRLFTTNYRGKCFSNLQPQSGHRILDVEISGVAISKILCSLRPHGEILSLAPSCRPGDTCLERAAENNYHNKQLIRGPKPDFEHIFSTYISKTDVKMQAWLYLVPLLTTVIKILCLPTLTLPSFSKARKSDKNWELKGKVLLKAYILDRSDQ